MARTGLRFNPGQVPPTYVSTALGKSGVVFADGPVRLFRIMVYNANAATRYLLLHDAIAVPSNGVAPASVPLAVPTLTTSSFDYGANNPSGGRLFTTGLCWSCSSTAGTLTITLTDDFFVEIQAQ